MNALTLALALSVPSDTIILDPVDKSFVSAVMLTDENGNGGYDVTIERLMLIDYPSEALSGEKYIQIEKILLREFLLQGSPSHFNFIEWYGIADSTKYWDMIDCSPILEDPEANCIFIDWLVASEFNPSNYVVARPRQVPEPSAAILLLLGVAPLLRRR